MLNIVVTQDFFPKIGGAHLWLYEVYRRWSEPVFLLTTKTCEDNHNACFEFDSQNHGALRIDRNCEFVGDIDLLTRACLKEIYKNVRHIATTAGNNSLYIHCLRAFPEGLTALAYKLSLNRSAKLIIYAHGEDILIARSSRQLHMIAKAVYAAADLVIANSLNTQHMVKSIYKNARTICIHPGVDSSAFAVCRENKLSARLELGWPDNTIILGTLARMEPRKNHAAVLQAVAELRREGCAIAYICGSDGEEMPRLIALAEKLNISPWVRFTGFVSAPEKLKIYAAADIYIMPSIVAGDVIEGFGIVFLEAAAAGIPSIAGNTGGQAEAVRAGITGLVVDGTKLDEIKAAIRYLIEDKELCKRMGHQGIEWAAEHDWEQVAQKTYRAIYGERSYLPERSAFVSP